MAELPLDDPRRHEILRALERVARRARARRRRRHRRSRARRAGRRAVAPGARRPRTRVSAIGHAHIDSAWLWPIRETKRKCARTFATSPSLMNEYPELVFGCSQAAQYEWMHDDYPSIFEGIVEAVARGPVGPGRRHVGRARREPRRRRGARAPDHARPAVLHRGARRRRATEVWIPDLFGYPAALPQIMRLGGIERFLTQKLSWNKTNKLPHHTFWWEGIDGSTVFTHFPPIDTYNAELFRRGARATRSRNFTDKGRGTRSLMPFGFGDGGGGPTRQMMRAVPAGARPRGLPEGRDRVAARRSSSGAIAEYPDAPRVVGRAVLRDPPRHVHQPGQDQGRQPPLRAAAARGRAVGGDRGDRHAGRRLPVRRARPLWKTVLLHQFHDILPGVVDRLGAPRGRGDLRGARRRAHDHHREHARPAGTAAARRRPTTATSVAARPTARSCVDRRRRRSGLDVHRHGAGAGDGVPSPPVWRRRGRRRRDADHRASRSSRTGARQRPTSRVDVRRRRAARRRCVTSAPAARSCRRRAGNLLQLHPDLPNEYDAWDLDDFYRRQVTRPRRRRLGRGDRARPAASPGSASCGRSVVDGSPR